MVVLRLNRVGKKSHPTFRVIVSDKRKDTHGTYLEQVGTYDPHQTPSRIEFQVERVRYWLSVGAQPSATVHNLLVAKGILTTPKVVVAKVKKAEVAAAATPAAAETPTEGQATEAKTAAPETVAAATAQAVDAPKAES